MHARVVAILLIAFLWPATASAHLMSTGFGPFYDGLAHLFITPVDLMAVLAVAMLAGLSGARSGRCTLLSVTAAWWIGGMISLSMEGVVAAWMIGAAAAPFFVGLAVALDLRLPLAATTSVAALVGAGFGLLNGLSLRATEAAILPLVGITTAVFLCVTLVTALTVHLSKNRDWRRVAIRVAGSWITAISLLMVGWTLRGE